jgi:hypothetical protein
VSVHARHRHLLAALVAACALVLPARAAAPPDDEARLRARLSPEATLQVLAIVREARDASLPTDPLVARALEGASRGADPTRIVSGVRALADAFGGARTALGAGASADEVVAGGSALLGGVPADTLARLRASRAGSLVIPLVVLGDLVSRGVPPGPASAAVLTAARGGATDRTLLRMRERIHERIEKGGTPERATGDVLQQWLRDPSKGSRSVTTPRSPPPKRPGQPKGSAP